MSLNVNGLRSPVKQSKILTKLKRENIDIAFLQETHLMEAEHEKLKRQGFKHIFSSSNGSKHTRGVVILISGRVTYEHISTIKDKEGRFIMIHGKVDGNLFTLYNVYIPPGSEPNFYTQVTERIATEAQGTLVCGGDFNTTLNPNFDSTGIRISRPQKITKKMNLLLSEIGLIDIWRHRIPLFKNFTFYSSPHSTYSRIDYFLIFGTDSSKIQDCHTETMDLSDHCPLYLSLKMTYRRKLTHWKLNPSVLNNNRIEQFAREIQEYLEFNDNQEVSPPILWDACKAVMRGRVTAVTSFLNKQREAKIKTFQTELENLESEHKELTDPKVKIEIKKKRNQIEELYTQEIQKKLLYTKQKYYELGSKYSKLLAYKLRKQQADSTIYKIRDPRTNNICHQIKEIKDCFKVYYEKLCSQPQVNTDQKMESLLKSLNLPKLTEEENKILASQITK